MHRGPSAVHLAQWCGLEVHHCVLAEAGVSLRSRRRARLLLLQHLMVRRGLRAGSLVHVLAVRTPGQRVGDHHRLADLPRVPYVRAPAHGSAVRARGVRPAAALPLLHCREHLVLLVLVLLLLVLVLLLLLLMLLLLPGESVG